MLANPSEQLIEFLLCILVGMGVGALFDTFRLSRRNKRRGTAVTAVEDALFFLLAAVFFFWATMKISDGAQRAYEWVASLLGLFLYLIFISRTLRRVMSWVLDLLTKIIKCFLKLLLLPVVWVGRVMHKPLIAVFHPAKLLGRNLRARYQTIRKERKKKKKIAKKIRKKV